MRILWNLWMCVGYKGSPGLKNGRLAKEVEERKFPTPLPSQKRLLVLLGEWCLPCRGLPDVTQGSARGCQMQGQLLRWRLPDANKMPARVLPQL